MLISPLPPSTLEELAGFLFILGHRVREEMGGMVTSFYKSRILLPDSLPRFD